MNGKLAVDTNAIISYREGVIEVCRKIENANSIFCPVVVLGELLFGALNSDRSDENNEAVKKFVEYTILLPIDENIAHRYADIRLKIKTKGRPIPENDLWIAATCIEYDVPILTSDEHFDYVADLQVIRW